jgi:50S ribosomal protein L16 3-hydroxylase
VDPLSVREVLALAASDAAQSRLVRRRGARWTLEHGPFSPAKLKQLPRRDWTVLVQDTNHFSDRAERLLGRFDFIPHARVDDLMVSYAVPGGGVGAHVDSYDVFLLQGHGRRRWQISRQRDHAFIPGLPLRVLERFEPQEEWVLEAGDMLYLPPHVAHHGVAETECLTWSVGFRAPDATQVVAAVLDTLRDSLAPAGTYRDPGAPPAKHPGEIPRAMFEHAERSARTIRWTRRELEAITGRLLTEPKAHVFFDPPPRTLSLADFTRRAARGGVALDLKSRLLFSGTMFHINGETHVPPAAARPALRRLADARVLHGPVAAPAAFWALAHEWHGRGYLRLQREET